MKNEIGRVGVLRISPETVTAGGSDTFAYRECLGVGERKVFAFMATIAPGEYIPPHIHPNPAETYVYIVSGLVRHYYGSGLAEYVDNERGELVFIPPEMPHQPTNLSDSEAVCAMIFCNYDQNSTEWAVPYDQFRDKTLWELRGSSLRDWSHQRHVGPAPESGTTLASVPSAL
jgi:uncharacterized RmlC-like cupin family protein